MTSQTRGSAWGSAHGRRTLSRQALSRFHEPRVLLPCHDRNLLERGNHVVDQTQVSSPEKLHCNLIGEPRQHLLVDRVEANTPAHASIVELHLDIDRLDELQLQQPGDEQFGHLDAWAQVLESPDDALQITRRLPLLGEQRLAAFRAYPRIIEIDREVRAVGIERSPLQNERSIGLPFLPLFEEQILALIETQHRSAVELARLRVLRKQDRIM